MKAVKVCAAISPIWSLPLPLHEHSNSLLYWWPECNRGDAAPLGHGWHGFDPRNNDARVGRILIARGKDAADVALTTTIAPSTLESLQVWTA